MFDLNETRALWIGKVARRNKNHSGGRSGELGFVAGITQKTDVAGAGCLK